MKGHAIYFSRLFMILLVHVGLEVELTSCENVLTYFITKDAKLCKSFYSATPPPPLFIIIINIFLCTLYVPFVLLFSPLSLDFCCCLSLALEPIVDLVVFLPHVFSPVSVSFLS